MLAEQAFSELKDQLRTGWDKVTIAALFKLEMAIERCLNQPHLIIKQRLRVAMMFNALKASWKGAVGTATPRPEIERKLGRIEPLMCDGEFCALKERADTLLQDLCASARILTRRLLPWIFRH